MRRDRGQPGPHADRVPWLARRFDLTVEATAQLDLSAPTATTLTVWGNFYYSGLTGGASIGSLTIALSGVGKTFTF